MLYVDTSVIVSALTNETDTPLSQTWLARQEASELTISDWTATEFASALSIKLRTGALGIDHRAAAISEFTRLCVESLQTLPVARQDFRAAARFADQSELNLRASDALHLAICANHGASLCTLDRRLAQAAPRVGVPVHEVTLSE
ncbi:MAG TPA: type II toxin-antitoxin system VapC family toxin [Roseiarcus sp.]|nr:type II toxin-antitoxin system VapC family toxin [Roseiarcus sp.]